MNGSRPIAVRCGLLLFLALANANSGFSQATLDVAPGLTIPDTKTPWALDVYQGKQQLVPIHHSMATMNRHTGSNFAGSVAESFFFKPKISYELQGLSSKTQLHVNDPAIYILFDSDLDEGGSGASSDEWTFVIARAQEQKDRRIVDKMALSQFSGKAARTANLIATDVTQLPNHWYRIVPKGSVPEGEYAILCVWKRDGTSSLEVWDFGIHTDAANEKDAIQAKTAPM